MAGIVIPKGVIPKRVEGAHAAPPNARISYDHAATGEIPALSPETSVFLGNTIRIYDVRYEWDELRNRQNQRKHDGISFEVAALAFEDERCLVIQDRVDENRPDVLAVLLVVHVYRENRHGEEVIRFLSARRAEKHEVRRYQEQAVD